MHEAYTMRQILKLPLQESSSNINAHFYASFQKRLIVLTFSTKLKKISCLVLLYVGNLTSARMIYISAGEKLNLVLNL